MGRKANEVLETAHRLMPAWRGRPADRIEYLPGGYTNRNYRIDIDGASYALRIVDGGAPPRPGESDYLAVCAAPDVVGYDAETGHMLTRWIEGRSLADAPPTVAEAGRYLAELHAEIPAGVRCYDYRTEIEDLFARSGNLDRGVAARFDALAWSPAESRGCHNDLNPWNVIRVAPDSIQVGPNAGADTAFRTLDWESAGDNDRLFDLVGLGLGLEWTMDQMATCIVAYNMTPIGNGSPMRVPPGRLQQTVCAYRIREYAWAVRQIAAGNDRVEIREQAATNRLAVLRPD